MSGIISRFRIEGLHNSRTIDIPINDNILVLVGENGAGKSTVANFIYLFLTNQWSRMLEYKFKRILVVLDAEEIEIRRSDILGEDNVPDNIPPNIARNIDTFMRRIGKLWGDPTDVVHHIANELGIPPWMVEEYLARPRRSIPPKLKEIQQTIEKYVSSQILYLPTYRRIEQDLSSIFPELGGAIRRYNRQRVRRKEKENSFIELVEFGMKDVERTISQKMFEIKEGVRKDLSDLTGTYLRDVIEGAYHSVDPSIVNEFDESTTNELFKRIPKEILSAQDKNALRNIIAEISATGQIKDENKVVAHFLTKLIELYKKQQVDEQDIREFIRVCNEGYLSGKFFEYDDAQFDVYITQEFEGEHFSNLSMKSLSSGEKQIISLFSHLYLSGRSDFFVIIDEPELSLSVPWQKRFLPDILERCKGLVAVTHSPFIFDNDLRPYTHSLDEFIEVFEYDPSFEDEELLEDEILF